MASTPLPPPSKEGWGQCGQDKRLLFYKEIPQQLGTKNLILTVHVTGQTERKEKDRWGKRHSMEGAHRKKSFTSFPSPAWMSLTKLPLSRNNSVMTSLFLPRDSLVVTSRLGTGNSRTFFYGAGMTYSDFSEVQFCTRLCFVIGKCIAGMKKGIIGLRISVWIAYVN